MFIFLSIFIKNFLLTLVLFYRLISFFLIPWRTCRFYPSCSEYALKKLLSKQPIGLSIASIVKRLLSCHSLSNKDYMDLP